MSNLFHPGTVLSFVFQLMELRVFVNWSKLVPPCMRCVNSMSWDTSMAEISQLLHKAWVHFIHLSLCKYMHSEAMQSLDSFWDTGSREENNASCKHLLFWFKWENFLRKRLGSSWTHFCCYSELFWHLSGVSGEKPELCWLCQPCWEQPVLQPWAFQISFLGAGSP